jgi:hypothetical protein
MKNSGSGTLPEPEFLNLTTEVIHRSRPGIRALSACLDPSVRRLRESASRLNESRITRLRPGNHHRRLRLPQRPRPLGA